MDNKRTGVYFSFLLMSLFMLSLASAAEWDNSKEYDEESKVVTITNNFGFGDVIGQARLKTSLNEKVGAGYGIVALLDVWAYEDYEDALKEFTFKDMKTGEGINRKIDLKILDYEEVEVNDYISDCYFDYSNSTNVTEICNSIINGSHLETREVWRLVTPADIKQNEVLTVGIFTDVQVGDYVDWIPTIYGVEIEEWATWTQSLNTNLDSYWKFDEGSGIVIDSLGINNLTNTGTASNVSGKILSAYDFDGTNDYFSRGNIANISDTKTYTVNVWIAPDDTSFNIIMANAQDTTDRFAIMLRNGEITARSYTPDIQLNGNYPIALGVWAMVTVIHYSNDTMVLMVNGNVITGGSEDTTTQLTSNFAIGSSNSLGSVPFDGKIDEVGLWSRALTTAEITQLYNGGDGITYTDVFGTAPSVTLTSPVDNANLTQSSVDFIAVVTDERQVVNVSLILNGTIVQTNTTGGNNTYTFTETLIEGIHTWSILAWDNDTLSNQSETRTFNYTQPPIFIDLNSPPDSSTHQSPAVNMSCNAYDPIGIEQLNLTVFGEAQITVTNSTPGENLSISQFVNFSEGNYTWGCSAKNVATSATSSNRTFEVLYADSNINLFTPINESSSGISLINFTFNASNINGLENVTLFLDGIANQTNSSGIEGNYTFDITLGEGNYTWYILAVSSLGTQTNSSFRTFEVLYSSPVINLFQPENNSDIIIENVTFIFNVSDVNGIENVSLFLNEELNGTNSSGFEGNYSLLRTLADGVYNWSIRATSTLGKITDSGLNFFILHTAQPVVNITAPSGTLNRPPYVNETLIYNITEEGENVSHFEECWYVYPSVVDSPCYQESVNISNQTGIDGNCSLEYDGSYSSSEHFLNFNNIFDGDFNTFGSEEELTTREILVNYTKPKSAIGANWTVKDGLGEEILKVLDSCFDYDNEVLELKIISRCNLPNLGSWSCKNETGFQTLRFNQATVACNIYEEAITWENGINLNCSANQQNFTYINGQNSISVFAEDEFGFITSDTSTWEYLFDYWLIDHITPQYEGTQGVFVLNTSLLTGETIEEAIFEYNGTNYSTTIISSSGKYLITASIALPSVEVDTNFTLSFYVVVDGVTYNFLEETQEVLNIDFITCAGIDLLMNISLFDEEFKTPLEGDIELNIQAHSKTSDGIVAELNNTYENITYQEICLSPNASFSNLYINAEMRYFTDGYATEFYYIQGADLNDYPINLSLFDLNQNDSTEFVVTYKNNAFIFEEGVVIQLQRKYVGEDTYEVVEAPVTSDGGKAILHIDLNSNKYRASIVKDGELLDFFDNIVFSCDNELSGDCTYDFDGTVDPNNDIPIETIRDFSYSVSVDEDNQTITVLFAVPSGTPSTINVLLEQKDMFGNLTSCNTTLITSAGSITCDYTDTIEASILELSISKSDVELAVLSYMNDPDLDMDGMNFFIAFLFMISLVGMAIASPEWMIIISVMVLIISGTLLLLKGMNLVMGLGAIAWVVIVAAIIILKMAKQEDR